MSSTGRLAPNKPLRAVAAFMNWFELPVESEMGNLIYWALVRLVAGLFAALAAVRACAVRSSLLGRNAIIMIDLSPIAGWFKRD
jgi:hypothetical protein